MAIKRKKRIKKRAEEDKSTKIGLFLKRFYKPIITILVVVAFFVTYNTYLVDRSLKDVEFALAETVRAESLGDVEGLDILVHTALLKEIAPVQIETESMTSLEFVQDVISKKDSTRQLEDASFMLKEVVKSKRPRRFFLFNLIDSIDTLLRNFIDKLERFLSRLGAKSAVSVEPDKMAIGLARKYKEEGKLEEALQQYENALASIPRYHGMVKVELGNLYQKTGRFKKAKNVYEAIIKANPGSREAKLAKRFLVSLKEIKSLTGRKGRIAQEIARTLDTPRLQKLYYELGTVNTSLFDFKSAEIAYENAYELDGTTDLAKKAKFNLAWALKMQGKVSEAEGTFKEITEESSGTKLARDSAYWFADTLRDGGKYHEAIEYFEKFAEDFEGSKVASMAIFNVGYTYLYNLNDPESAKKAFERMGKEYYGSELSEHVMSKVAPQVGSIHRDLGFRLIARGKWNEAMEEFEKAISYDASDGRSHSGFGAAKALTDQWREAIDKAERGIELAPDDGYTHANLAYLHLLKNDYGTATDEYKKAVDLKPDYAEALYNLGWMAASEGDYEVAISYYKKAIRVRPGFVEAHNNLGEAYWHEGMYAAAAEGFKTAIQVDPNYAVAHYNLGVYCLLTKKCTQAKHEFKEAIKFDASISKAREALQEAEDSLLPESE